MIVLQVATIILLLSMVIFKNIKSKELLLFVSLVCFYSSANYLSAFAKYYLYIISMMMLLLLYVSRKIFPVINKTYKSPVTDKSKVFVFLCILFLVAMLNIFNFSTGLILESKLSIPSNYENFTAEDLLKISSITLIVLSIVYAKFEEDKNVD